MTADPEDCNFQFNPTGTAKFTTSCDIATAFLTRNSVPYDVVRRRRRVRRPPSRSATQTVESYDAVAAGDKAAAMKAAFEKGVNLALQDGGYPLVRGAAKVADPKLDAFVAANPELDARRRGHPAGEKKA